MSAPIDLSHPLVVGFGVTGRAVVDALVARDVVPTVVEDRPTEDARAAAATAGIELVEAPTSDEVEALVANASVVLPSPGVPDRHPAMIAARRRRTPVASEFDLAAGWDDRPLVAVTGTNGKTTVTTIVTDALERSGIRASAVGNTDVPLVAAIADPDIDVFVVEASSFRLGHTQRFTPSVATFMNLAPDHLDVHADAAAYEAAKASIWAHLPTDAIAVANAEDPTVLSHLPAGRSVVTFGVHRGDWRICDGALTGPDGPIVSVDRLARSRPHDLSNAACVAATAIAAGAEPSAVADALAAFDGLAHRLELVAEHDGVRWFDDSKATVPQATIAAVGGFDSVVLIAGGRNKGLDLAALADTVPPVRAVIALGEAAEEVTAAFAPTAVQVDPAPELDRAVELAAETARPGDAVLLSPACTSFDAYPNYGARGDHFRSLVEARFPR